MSLRAFVKNHPILTTYLSGCALTAAGMSGQKFYKDCNRYDSVDVFATKVMDTLFFAPVVIMISLPWPLYAGKIIFDKVAGINHDKK
jgi:hypothetical protein